MVSERFKEFVDTLFWMIHHEKDMNFKIGDDEGTTVRLYCKRDYYIKTSIRSEKEGVRCDIPIGFTSYFNRESLLNSVIGLYKKVSINVEDTDESMTAYVSDYLDDRDNVLTYWEEDLGYLTPDISLLDKVSDENINFLKFIDQFVKKFVKQTHNYRPEFDQNNEEFRVSWSSMFGVSYFKLDRTDLGLRVTMSEPNAVKGIIIKTYAALINNPEFPRLFNEKGLMRAYDSYLNEINFSDFLANVYIEKDEDLGDTFLREINLREINYKVFIDNVLEGIKYDKNLIIKTGLEKIPYIVMKFDHLENYLSILIEELNICEIIEISDTDRIADVLLGIYEYIRKTEGLYYNGKRKPRRSHWARMDLWIKLRRDFISYLENKNTNSFRYTPYTDIIITDPALVNGSSEDRLINSVISTRRELPQFKYNGGISCGGVSSSRVKINEEAEWKLKSVKMAFKDFIDKILGLFRYNKSCTAIFEYIPKDPMTNPYCIITVSHHSTEVTIECDKLEYKRSSSDIWRTRNDLIELYCNMIGAPDIRIDSNGYEWETGISSIDKHRHYVHIEIFDKLELLYEKNSVKRFLRTLDKKFNR